MTSPSHSSSSRPKFVSPYSLSYFSCFSSNSNLDVGGQQATMWNHDYYDLCGGYYSMGDPRLWKHFYPYPIHVESQQQLSELGSYDQYA